MSDGAEDDILRVFAVQGEALKCGVEQAHSVAAQAGAAIGDAEQLLKKLEMPLPQSPDPQTSKSSANPPRLRSWEEILAEARLQGPAEVSFSTILGTDEIASASQRLSQWQAEFVALHSLTPYDYALAGAAGVFGGLADILLVQAPKHPGFLGGPSAEGGWLSNFIKERFGELLPESAIKELEEFHAPYDASTNWGLDKKVVGLGPRTHRMASLGHDPMLGWFFGVRDILRGEFSAIGSDGRLVIQEMPNWSSEETAIALFVRVAEAFKTVGGHLLSDVATPAGLPPPLFGLAQFFQQGAVGDHSISDVARTMYRSGYDLRHWLASGVTVAIVEFVVRTGWMARELREGKSLKEALPACNRRLTSCLLLAHFVAAAVNAGKVAVSQNPLSINLAQWQTFVFVYLVPQMHWLLVGRENAEAAMVGEKLDASWRELDDGFAALWAETFGDEPRFVL